MVQRKLEFEVDEYPAPKGRAKKNVGVYAQIYDELLAYKKIEVQGLIGEERSAAKERRVLRLLAIRDLCEQWWAKYGSSSTKSKSKVNAVNKLRAAVRRELIFSTTFQGGSGISDEWDETKRSFGNALVYTTHSTKFFDIRSKKRALKELLARGDQQGAQDLLDSLPDDDKKLLKSFLEFKETPAAGGAGMTSKEVKALFAYTTPQYRLMNPSQAEDRTWLTGAMGGFAKDTSGTKPEEAMLINRSLSAVAIDAVKKLPPWNQGGKAIFRGETVPAKEWKSLKHNSKKRYPHLVSTSQKESVARTEAYLNRKGDRDWVVLYEITSSTGGRDIAKISNSEDEVEVLFLPGTVFKVTGVSDSDENKKFKKLQVTAG